MDNFFTGKKYADRRLCLSGTRNLGNALVFHLFFTILVFFPFTAVQAAENTQIISLAECVALAMRRNTWIKLAYMDRVVQKYSFTTTANYTFRPDIDWQTALSQAETKQTVPDDSSSLNRSIASALYVRQNLPTGGAIGVQWQPWSKDLSKTNQAMSSSDISSRQDSWRVNFSQPLGKFAGSRVANLVVDQAKYQENLDVLQLKATAINTVTSVIKAYRQLLLAKWDIAINEASLERAKTLLENNKTLIDMGKMAAQDIIQSESDRANKELSLEISRNAFDQARLAMLQLLDLSRDLMIEPEEQIEIVPFTYTEDQIFSLAKANQPDWLSMLIYLELARMELVQARSEQKLDVALSGSIGTSNTRGDISVDNSEKSWELGVVVDIPISGRTRRELKGNLIKAQVNMDKANISLQKALGDLAINTRDLVQRTKTLEKQIELAESARKLSEKKLEVELVKQKAGRSTNFQIVTYQDELRSAKINELNAKISYLNSLSDLDKFMGTVPLTWGIDLASAPTPPFERESDKMQIEKTSTNTESLR
ncbi:MAG: hypothetical protein CVV41_11850 [Candidatus Riflebacteria bacterium HGW-Riflebacteria-1]|jgi:outer membrane protein TolC|nr:MAG: hypothetical protein CVV41_11850 [Candidatus Riflebacteria bacterium HGW-Riflebacteria-1]